MNNPYIRAIPCGASRGFGTAMGLAKIYGILSNGGSYKGKQLLSLNSIKKMIQPRVTGIDKYIMYNVTYAAGMNIRESRTVSNIRFIVLNFIR